MAKLPVQTKCTCGADKSHGGETMISTAFRRLALFLIFVFSASTQALSIDNSTRVALQELLRTHISLKTQDGLFTYFDEDKVEVWALTLATIHPVILKRENRYMLCADFLAANGDSILVDFIILPIDNSYIVEKEVLGRRSHLMTFFEKIL